MSTFIGKKVLITGHTGFKGSWLAQWLLLNGAEIFGISDKIPTDPSLFEILKLEKKINHILMDIRDKENLINTIQKISPDFVFHLAAQPIVSLSYENPLETFEVNAVGTANVLEGLRHLNTPCVGIFITSDKCYHNEEWVWGYRETDKLGGKDIYSASKAAAEVIFQAYFHSYFEKHPSVRIASVRAGNVIGGGDWALNRLVPDCMQSWSREIKVEIRNPESTRPWQHVLEPLSGYLQLAAKLSNDKTLSGQSYNFGPKSENNASVLSLLEKLSQYWDFKSNEKMVSFTQEKFFPEAGLLKLNCDKALAHLNWSPVFNLDELARFTSEWYYLYYQKDTDMEKFTINQIKAYEELRHLNNKSCLF